MIKKDKKGRPPLTTAIRPRNHPVHINRVTLVTISFHFQYSIPPSYSYSLYWTGKLAIEALA